MTLNRPDSFRVSCVIPAYNEAANLKTVILDVIKTLQSLCSAYEVIVVNDGSQDVTQDVIRALMADHSTLVLIDLSRNFGKEAAMTAGLAMAKGDIVFQIDADGQHPLDLFPCHAGKVERRHRCDLRSSNFP